MSKSSFCYFVVLSPLTVWRAKCISPFDKKKQIRTITKWICVTYIFLVAIVGFSPFEFCDSPLLLRSFRTVTEKAKHICKNKIIGKKKTQVYRTAKLTVRQTTTRKCTIVIHIITQRERRDAEGWKKINGGGGRHRDWEGKVNKQNSPTIKTEIKLFPRGHPIICFFFLCRIFTQQISVINL